MDVVFCNCSGLVLKLLLSDFLKFFFYFLTGVVLDMASNGMLTQNADIEFSDDDDADDHLPQFTDQPPFLPQLDLNVSVVFWNNF